MELRRELIATIGALVALNLSLAFGSIGLFVRMGPAIERILKDNVVSIVAAEETLGAFAEAGSNPLSPEGKAAVRKAVENAAANVTEKNEGSVIDAIQSDLTPAIDGDVVARANVVARVRDLIRINQDAMVAGDRHARRLGSAGAWVGVIIGFISFALSVVVVVRLQNRFIRPLADVYSVLEGARAGNGLRRCRATEGPHEVIRVAESVNRLLDERAQHAAHERVVQRALRPQVPESVAPGSSST